MHMACLKHQIQESLNSQVTSKYFSNAVYYIYSFLGIVFLFPMFCCFGMQWFSLGMKNGIYVPYINYYCKLAL